MAAPASSPPAGVPSRYRSQRQKHFSAEEQEGPSSPPPALEGNDDGFNRSTCRSRYHRRPGTAGAQSPPDIRATSGQQQPELPSRYHSKHRPPPLQPLGHDKVVQDLHAPHRTISNERQNGARYESPPAELGARAPRTVSSDERDSDAENSRSRTRNDRPSSSKQNLEPRSPPPIPAPPESPPVTSQSPPAPTGELFPPPKPVERPVRRDGPPQSGQIRATQSMSELPTYGEDSPGCFGGLFKRKRGDASTAPTGNNTQHRPKSAKDGPQTIRPGGGGIVPGIDAPKSAVNAGDRNVIVQCGKSQRPFTVSPDTTSVDIIKTAATVMAERIDLKSALLVEHFSSVGVERPLRRYETIRDVLNSWADDRQNVLTLVDPGTGTVESELTITGVPTERPEGNSWWLIASYKPGKWEKRYVTLKSDGQMYYQKDPAKAKETINFCHLSDFDIYSPSAERAKKKIKPPKKHCFAIKSQQKTAMFEEIQDFVHFFSTGDQATAQSFYRTVQVWRSWYLVHVLGEGRKEKSKLAIGSPERIDRHTSNDYARGHRVKESLESHYQLGSFKSLIDMDQFEKRQVLASQNEPADTGAFEKSAAQFDTSAPVERRSNTVKRSHPPAALNNKVVLSDNEPLANLNRSSSINKRHNRPILSEDEPLANLNRSSSTARRRPSTDQRRSEPSEFSNKGLLGRSYSQRRKEQSEKGAQPQPFTTGPNLLNSGVNGRDDSNGGVHRQSSMRKHSSGGDLKRGNSIRQQERGGELGRSSSQRHKPKPLVDLTPEFKEAPQFRNKGRGYKPEHIGAGGLIDSATSPEDPLNIPQNTVFRNTNSGQYRPPNSPGLSSGLVDLTPRHQEPIHHARKGRGYSPDSNNHGGLVMNASSPEDPLGLPQNNVFRSTNAMPEGRRQASSGAENTPQRSHSTRKSPGAFTGEGLLASESNRQGWGTETRGRGVIDGSRAGGKPLVDLTSESQYTQGSLLNQAERTQEIPAPIVDRTRET